MIARIDGVAVPLGALCWPDMNFGQFGRAAPLGEYELTIPHKVFVDGMAAEYADLVVELCDDDLLDPEAHTPYVREIGYPPPNVALDHPRQAYELLRVFLYPAVFGLFLPCGSASARFMMNSVDAVEVTPSAVVIRGRGYHRTPGFAS